MWGSTGLPLAANIAINFEVTCENSSKGHFAILEFQGAAKLA